MLFVALPFIEADHHEEEEHTALEEQKGADKKKFMANYKKAMKRMIGLIGELEAALKADDNAKAGEIVGKLNDGRKKGHERFKPEDDD